ncbi:MAG TPA: aldehyde dehydrogenase family protein, partial [Ruminiclostridium sp.]|nr:aldehyde dehydrogenase family protein [Ruminiclostridium sp.]
MVEQDLIKKITAEVLAKMQDSAPESCQGDSGVFDTVDQAISAARKAYEQLKILTKEKREEIIQTIRDAAYDNADTMAEMAVEESGMGRVSDKIIKNRLAARKTPGTEDLTSEAWTGDCGLTLIEMGPYGVIGAITPTTNPTETVICNSIGMIAAGNAVFFSPHPSAKNTSLWTIK